MNSTSCLLTFSLKLTLSPLLKHIKHSEPIVVPLNLSITYIWLPVSKLCCTIYGRCRKSHHSQLHTSYPPAQFTGEYGFNRCWNYLLTIRFQKPKIQPNWHTRSKINVVITMYQLNVLYRGNLNTRLCGLDSKLSVDQVTIWCGITFSI